MDETTATRRLTRDPSGKVIAGVAGGLGAYFGIDPMIFRLAFVGFALFGGGGVLLYLIAWVAMPAGDGGDERAAAPRSSAELAAWLGLGLVLIALLMLGGALFTLRPGFVAALVLLAGGFLLFQHSGQARTGSQAAAVPASAPAAAPAGPTAPAPTAPLPPASGGPPPPPPPRQRPPRSRLGRVTFALLFLTLGVLGFLHATAVVFPDPGDYAALALSCVGAGLLAGAWWGRARWLIPIGLLLIPVTLAATVVPHGMALDSGAGEVRERPRSSAQLASEYELGGGQLTLDLSELRLLMGERRHVRASIGVGELVVIVPSGMAVSVRAGAGVGEVEVFGVRRDGIGPQVQARQAAAAVTGELVLDLRAGLGQIQVVRLPTSFPMSPLSPFGGLRPRGPGQEVF